MKSTPACTFSQIRLAMDRVFLGICCDAARTGEAAAVVCIVVFAIDEIYSNGRWGRMVAANQL
jgi:hypothetical protein